MAQFAYTARDSTGQSANGSLQATSLEEAARQLRAAGKFVISIEPAGTLRTAPGSKGIRIPRAEVINLSNQLAVMLETGVTLADALECCAENHSNPMVKKLVIELSNSVKSGVDFSSALAKHPRSFPRIYVALIKASEKSGMMSKLLGRATQYMKDEQETLRKVKGALTYPSIMFGFAILTTVFLLVFVMPRFTVIYANKGAALPVPTKVLMTMSDFLVHKWFIVIPVVGGIVFGAWSYFKTNQGRRVKDWLQLNVPLIGSMFRKMHLSRGLRTIGTMSGSGVGLVECVETAQTLTNNSYYQALWRHTLDQIQNGKPFSDSLQKSELVPGAVSRMLASGEKSGKLAHVMEQVASFAEHEMKEKIAELTRYIEPAMILLMGLLIGGITMALLLPVFSISKVVAS